ncbi:RND transporter, HAE1/HME family, permease protein [Coleofasciculus chthonoplastes PCC 7420]|uniref:RND transporter, HAE1/HME family, permease protein n=1 Tax=Coleofasciculus chthonoplastes PCC 7420 TaxID=118168 RepID=B4VPG4_9CYAN|nr:efflux RND transporter permease subunit [Coleofasciculus chthonoplastes]EDX76013.1 RND transporter, HAE1/HME family, permease protein [Coleofasciculus chthonoplastes PCC 7420]
MSFHLSAWSIKKPVPTIVLFLILGIFGLVSFFRLGIDSNPNIDIPAVMVTVTQPGAGPTELETQVTKKIEDSVAGLGNIDELTSTVTEGSSTTTVSFVLGTDSDRATNDVRNAVAQIRQDLPQDVNEPIVKRLEFAGGSIMTYAVASETRSVEQLSDLVDRTISRALLNVPGVAQIDRLGGVDREIRVDLDPSRLQAYGITATQVNDQIRNLNIDLPGGRGNVGGSEQNIRTLGSAETVAELRSYRIVLPNGATVPLSSLGEVEDSFAEQRQAASLNGESVVAFSVRRSTGSTLVTVEEGVREAVTELEKTLPDDVTLALIFTRADAIRDSYQATIDALVLACILTVIAVGLFLRDWRVTLITATALPLSIIPTFGVMKLLGYTLNGMTLLALALAVGNLVDDAICMIENIDQHLDMGKKPFNAALDASREIGLAVVATTATIVAVFIPVAFMGGVPGQFFQPFGVTVAVSTMFSTLVACTMTPMLSAYWLKSKRNREQETSKKRIHPYRNLLTWALRHRITTLLIALAFFIGSLQLVPLIPKGLFDSGDTGLSTVMVELPPGSTLSETEEIMQQLNQSLQENLAVDKVFTTADNINSGTVYANLLPKDEREVSQQEFEQEMRQVFRTIPGARISFQSQGAGGGGKDLSIVLKSENAPVLTQTAETLEKQMRDIPGLVEVTSSTSLVKPEIVIQPDPERAADLGVSVGAIARTASLALIGDNESNLAKFDLADRQIPIRVQLNPDTRADISTLKNLQVPSQTGNLVPISAVADIRLGSGPAQIDRFDRNRQVSVEANLEGISLGDALETVKALPAMNPLPPDVAEEPAGDAKIMQDIFTRFATALGAAILSIYAILVLLYSNFLYPFGILVALPLSIGGALLGLLVTQKELGLFALIGIVLLMGLVTKNAILLVDFALAGIKEGKPQFKAVVEAGVSRLRPILMTSVSTIAGMMPIALELGADGEVRSPMAIAVIGGFTTSTLLTLVVVPVLFTYVDNLYRWMRGLFGGKKKQVQL